MVNALAPLCVLNCVEIFCNVFLLNQDFERFIYIERFHLPFLKGGEKDAKLR